jgi:hypothetical protein
MGSTPYVLSFCVEANLRSLSRMLACLDRVGKDLYLEAADGQARSENPQPSWLAKRVVTCR